ncbi:MAG: ribosomal protein S18-alanine N-acetyltransferase [candidate division Zixibacteria bacterium]|nr:ribosomal protein S18-alanine N-acetyltransferase [candidate division Zixibacteria bacterium]
MGASDINIREMTESDLPDVMAIENDVFTDAWPISTFRHDLTAELSYLFVAQVDNEIAGYVLLLCGVTEGHLANIAVAKNYQRKSIAQKLISFILRIAQAKQLAQIILEVRPSNAAAIALYRKFGFDDWAIQKEYYSNPREDCLVMIKPLTGDTDCSNR